MKTYLLFLFCMLPFFGFAQASDTVVIDQVIDSLIQVSLDLVNEKKMEEALNINEETKKMALKNFGSKSMEYSHALNQHGVILFKQRDYVNAEKWYLKSKAIREEAIGTNNLFYAQSLYNLALLYKSTGQYKEAEFNYKESRIIRQRILGKNNSTYASTIQSLANLYLEMGQYENAEKLFLEAKDIRKEIFGKDSPSYAKSLNNLANLYWNIGQYQKVESLLLESKDIREKKLGKKHPSYATSLHNLSVLYELTNEYDKAERLMWETLNIREEALGKEHPEYAASIHNLAGFYLKIGEYDKAEPLFQKSLSIWGKTLGKQHPNYSMNLNNLAILYLNKGQYNKTESFLLESKWLREKTIGKEHPDYAINLQSLANLYSELGQFQKAEIYYLEAKNVWEKILGKEHSDYALSLGSLANLYVKIGQYEKSEKLYIEALEIWGKVLGEDHPEYAMTIYNLALLQMKFGDYEEADSLFLKSMAIQEIIIGKEHPDYASSLHSLGVLNYHLGLYKNSETYFLEAIKILKNKMGEHNIEYVENLVDLANLYEFTLRINESEPLYVEIFKKKAADLEKAISFLSEDELKDYFKLFTHDKYKLLNSLYNRYIQILPIGSLSEISYGNCLFFKGFLLNATSSVKNLTRKEDSSENLFNELKSYRRRLAREYTKTMSQRDSIIVAKLEEKANSAEKALAREVAGYGTIMEQVKWEEVQAVLKNNEAAIEFVHFPVTFPNPTDSILYAALVVKPGIGQPVFVPLAEESDLKTLLEKPNDDHKKMLAGLYSRGFDKKKKVNLEGLYQLIWQPLDSLLKDVKTIYYAPSGLLHRINQDAIPIPGEMRLGDKYHLHLLGSTRQVVIPSQFEAKAKDAVLFGGIDYEKAINRINEEEGIEFDSTAHYESSLSFSSLTRDMREGSWIFLPGTQKETNTIANHLKSKGYKVELRQGQEATEEAFKKIGEEGVSPRILHIATHGFFFPDPVDTLSKTSVFDGEPVFKLSDDPMIRSGLILAGANTAWQGNPLGEDEEDGILTAYEISQMNLRNTELVVLSACETGLGDIDGNEGVYGLQRALKIAGAKYLIMSLWQVPDLETQAFMTTFYEKWLAGKPIHQAFKDSQQLMKELNEDPFYWAGFVLIE